MGVPSGTVQTFTLGRIREDLANVINLLDAYETPFYSAIGSEMCKNRTPEWLAHSAPTADTTNYHVEGDDAANTTAAAQPTRFKNVCQLLNKVVQVSTTLEAVDSAGMKEMARQLLLHGITLKTELETFMTNNSASVLGNASTAGQMGSIESWLVTNPVYGSGGSAGGFNTGTGLTVAPTDGTQRTFTETILKSGILNTWKSGGKNLNILVGPAQKQVVSGFSGISTRFQTVVGTEQAKILGAADIYVSDFGSHRIYPDRFSRNRTALILDYSTWSKCWLQPLQSADLARTGNSTRKMLWCEVTLKALNEKANGACADLS